ncbi:MAG: DsbA family protein, partial [Saprospiraceae bacterium]|nr:DsbA family protein [Saprospiraceae bacterium]
LAIYLSSQEKPTILYFGDPMCSWCYGISPELDAVKEHFRDKADFRIVLGGLRPYNTETMGDLKLFLTDHWKEVQRASGQPFRYEILDRSEMRYDTEPACRAVVTIREKYPDKAFEFFKGIQHAFYYENRDLSKIENYIDILKSLEIDVDYFQRSFDSEEMKERVKRDFKMSSSMGIHGFPTLVLKTGNEYHLIANGYTSSENMIERLNTLMK